MANELRGFRLQGGANVTTVTPAEPVHKPEKPANDIKPEPAPKVEEPVKEPEPAPKAEEPVKEPELAPKAEEPVKEPEPAPKAEEPVKEPEPAPKAEEPVKEPEIKNPEIFEEPRKPIADKAENFVKTGINPIKKPDARESRLQNDGLKTGELVSNVVGKGNKKHNNFSKNALPFIIGALAIGGIAWLISSLNKNKKNKKVVKNDDKKEPEKNVADKKEPEKKEPEKNAENDDEKMSTISYSVEYDNASSVLSDKEQKKLDALNKATAQLQKDKGDRTIVVASGASKNGTDQINQKFSDERTGVAVDSLKRNGATNVQIAAGVGERAATLESTSKDGHAGSKADRVSVVNAGLVTKADAEYWSEIARKELKANGFTQEEIDETIRKSIQNDKVIDLKYADTREAKNVLAQLEKENEPYRNVLKTEYGLVQKHTKEEDRAALASKNSEVFTATSVQNISQTSSNVQKPENVPGKENNVSDASRNRKEETVKLNDAKTENTAANKEPEKDRKESIDKKSGEKASKELPKMTEDKLKGKKKLTDLGKEVANTKKKNNAKSSSKQR